MTGTPWHSESAPDSPIRRTTVAVVAILALGAAAACGGGGDANGAGGAGSGVAAESGGEAAAEAGGLSAAGSAYRKQLGEDSPKIRREDGRTYVYAGGDLESGEAEWFDFTGAPIEAEDLQFGIGKHAIPAIDDPVFVEPDDPRLLELPSSPYRPDEDPGTTDEIRVIGYEEQGVARAYPIALLDHHEVVNDRVRGKPVSVGW